MLNNIDIQLIDLRLNKFKIQPFSNLNYELVVVGADDR